MGRYLRLLRVRHYVKNILVLTPLIFSGQLLAGGALLRGLRWWALVCMALYLGLNIGYSYGLKNLPIVDIMILVSGFLLRLLYGSVITDITVSGWLYLTVMAMSFYLALGKRRNELMRLGNEQTRQVLRYYSRSFLDRTCTCSWRWLMCFMRCGVWITKTARLSLPCLW